MKSNPEKMEKSKEEAMQKLEKLREQMEMDPISQTILVEEQNTFCTFQKALKLAEEHWILKSRSL
jgi:DNA-binding protein H-NS